MATGRRVAVVPVAVAVGWELEVEKTVVVVHEVKPEVVVVRYPDGTTKELAAVKEDTPENGEELQGTQLPEGSTEPHREVEEEVEIEEEVDE